jgi:hypothetical protein
MALDITALVDYVNESTDKLLSKSFFGAKTADIIRKEGNVMTGVKYSEKIGMLATDAIFQNGAGCTRVSSGNTTLTQRQITVGEIAVVEDLCVKTLNKKYLGKMLAAGSMGESQKIPFEQEYTDLKSATIAEQLEIAIWLGDTASGNANLSRFDGLIKLIDAAASSVNANLAIYTGAAPIAAGTGIVASNVKSIVNAMWLALPARVQGKTDVRVWCGWDVFQKFVAAFTDQNLFNFAPAGSEVKAENGEIIIPGTFYKLTAVHGLDGTNRLFSMRTSNMVEAVDLENEEEKWEIIPDQFKNYLRFDVEFKFGVQVGYPDEIVSFKLTA